MSQRRDVVGSPGAAGTRYDDGIRFFDQYSLVLVDVEVFVDKPICDLLGGATMPGRSARGWLERTVASRTSFATSETIARARCPASCCSGSKNGTVSSSSR